MACTTISEAWARQRERRDAAHRERAITPPKPLISLPEGSQPESRGRRYPASTMRRIAFGRLPGPRLSGCDAGHTQFPNRLLAKLQKRRACILLDKFA